MCDLSVKNDEKDGPKQTDSHIWREIRYNILSDYLRSKYIQTKANAPILHESYGIYA